MKLLCRDKGAYERARGNEDRIEQLYAKRFKKVPEVTLSIDSGYLKVHRQDVGFILLNNKLEVVGRIGGNL